MDKEERGMPRSRVVSDATKYFSCDVEQVIASKVAFNYELSNVIEEMEIWSLCSKSRDLHFTSEMNQKLNYKPTRTHYNFIEP